MKYGILWDLDGTLLNTLEDLKNSVNYALAQYGLPGRSLQQVRSFVGTGARNLIRLSLPGLETDPPVDEVLATYRAHYQMHSQDATRPYEGVAEALEVLGKEFTMAVVSNKPDKDVKKLCADYFPGLYAMGEVADCPRKPAPDMLYRVAQELGIDRFVYVGDSDVDVLTAQNAGVKCLSVLWGFRDEADIRKAGGTHFCADPKMLPKMLREMME